MTIKNPEIECKTTPEKFSRESKITKIEINDDRRGIILNSQEEVVQALMVYNGSSVKGARATQDELMNEAGDKGSGLGAGLVVLVGTRIAKGFMEKLIQSSLSELKSNGRFKKSFDYDAMGTNFFKTTVDLRKLSDKYVLELYAAYVGSEPESELAETLGKPLALVRSNAKGGLSFIDDWWFSVSLEDVLKGLPISKRQFKGVIEYIVSDGYSERPEITFKHKEQEFSLNVSLEADRYLKPKGGKQGYYYMQTRGNNIIGGAWTTWAENGNDRTDPRAIQPAVVVSVSLPGERFSRQAAVTEEQMKVVQTARNYLADMIVIK